MRMVFKPGLKKLAKDFDDAGKQLRDFRPIWRSLLPLVRARHADRIISGGFAPLSESYRARKMRLGYPGETFRRTGRLIADLGRGRSSVSRSRLRWGPTEAYGFILSRGSTAMGRTRQRTIARGARRNERELHSAGLHGPAQAPAAKSLELPARPWIGMDEQIKSEAMSRIRDRVGRLLEQIGRATQVRGDDGR